VLERVVDTIAKLIDVASKIAAAGNTRSVSPPVLTPVPAPALAPGSGGSSTASPLLPLPSQPGATHSPSPTVLPPAGTPSMIGHGAVPAQVIRPSAAAAAAMQPQQHIQRRSAAVQEVMEGPPEISPEEVQYDPVRDLIGEGAFGKVCNALSFSFCACIQHVFQ